LDRTRTHQQTFKIFRMRAERDEGARAGDPYDRTPLTTVFAHAEWNLIRTLRDLVAEDRQARSLH
jgi:hypothetical protein